MASQLTHPTHGREAGSGLATVLTPALAPLKAIRKVAHSDVANAVMPRFYDEEPLLPRSEVVLKRTLAALPNMAELEAVKLQISGALGEKANAVQIAQIVGAIAAMKNAVAVSKRADLVEGLTFALHFEAQIEGVSPYVLAAALFDLAKRGPFFPDISEVLGKLPETHALFVDAGRRIGVLIDARQRMERTQAMWCAAPDTRPSSVEHEAAKGGSEWLI